MVRQFTRDVGRFKRLAVADYPLSTWQQIARDAGMPLDKFTRQPFTTDQETNRGKQ